MAKTKKAPKVKAEIPKPVVVTIAINPTQHEFETWIGQLTSENLETADLWRTFTAEGQLLLKLQLGK